MVAAVNAIRAEGYEWVVHIDIANFFDCMDTHILMRFLRASVNEPLIIRLIQMWLDMGGILLSPKLPGWYSHLENILHHVGGGVDQVINQLELNRKKTQITHFSTEIEFLGHIFDADGCYQPVPVSQKNIIQEQIQHALKKGTTHIIRSRRYLTQQQKTFAHNLVNV